MKKNSNGILSETPKEGVKQILFYLYDFEVKVGTSVIVNEGSKMYKKLEAIEADEADKADKEAAA